MADEPETPDGDEKVDESTLPDVDAVDVDEIDQTPSQSKARLAGWRRRLSRAGSALVASAIIVATLAGLAGWLGYRAYQKHEAQAQRELFVQVARQGAVNLTTINYTQVDADVQRILDQATGSFRE